MTATTISFSADEQTMAELRQLAGGGSLSEAICELIHVQYKAHALRAGITRRRAAAS